MMRIAYVVDRYPCGPHDFVVNEVLAHEDAGVEVEIYRTRFPADGRLPAAISRVRAPVRPLRTGSAKAEKFWAEIRSGRDESPALVAALDRALEDSAAAVRAAIALAQGVSGRVEHIHAHSSRWPASVARICSWITGIPYSVTFFGDDLSEVAAGTREYANIREASFVRTLCRQSLNTAHCMTNRGSRVRCIGPLVDLAKLQPISESLRKQNVIVRLDPNGGGIGRLIEAVGQVVINCPKVKFRIIVEDALSEILCARLRSDGLAERIEVVPDRPSDRLVDEIRNARLFLALGSWGDVQETGGLPVGLLEAMALGTPCIVEDVGRVGEVLSNSSPASLAAADDVKMLVESILDLLTRKTSRTRLAAAARKRVEENFDSRGGGARLRDAIRGLPERPEKKRIESYSREVRFALPANSPMAALRQRGN